VLQVASSALPLPNFLRASSSSSTGFGLGARSKSHAIRPLYCELLLPRIPRGGSGAEAFGFTVNTSGPDPLVDTVLSPTTAIKPGDVIKSVDGELATADNIAKILDMADDPASLDVVRYRIDSTPNSDERAETTAAPAADSPESRSIEAHKSPPPAMAFDAMFTGSLTVDNLKSSAKEGEMIRRASKTAVKAAKKDVSVKPGRVRMSVTPFSISVDRVAKVSKRQKVAIVPAPEPVFSISTDDIFSAVARKKKMLLMVQPDPPKPGVCYVLKFAGIKACKRAAVACGSLPGHVAYESPAKALKKKKKKRTKRKSKDTNGDEAEGEDVSGMPIFVPNLPPSPDAASADAPPTTASPGSAGADPPKKPRRKLVRGANKKETPVLPGFLEAMDAITDLDTFLDEHSSFRGNPAGETESNLSRAKSKKWMKQYSSKVAQKMISEAGTAAAAAPTAPTGVSTAAVAEALQDDDDDDDDDDAGDDECETETDTEAEGEADLEFFKVLAAKRKEREIAASNRRAQLAAASARLRDELNAQRSLEMARIAKEKDQERLMQERFREYCATGAEARLKELTFKFRWGPKEDADTPDSA